jgi:pimeloyl-ACP methyl ester carboxylesterase
LKPDDYGQRLLSAIPGSQLKTFENCGHFAQLEYADEWNRTAVEFLSS